jgi:hypothetical protein
MIFTQTSESGVKVLFIFEKSQYWQVLQSSLNRYRNEVNLVG